MRKSIVAAVAVACLALAGVAVAFTQHSVITFTTTHAGKSTGINAKLWADSPPGKAPKAAKQVIITFPTGTRFNFNVVPACTLSEKQLQAGRTCPAASQVGTGSATASPYPLQNVIAAVKAYAAPHNQMLVIATTTKPIKTVTVIHETVSGSKLIIPVPTSQVAGFKVILVALKLYVPAKGSGSKALTTTGRCTNRKFVIKSFFTYSDRSTFSSQSTSPCS